VGKKLRAAVERLHAKPTPTNRAAFENALLFSMVHTPFRRPVKSRGRSGLSPDPTTLGPAGEPMLLAYTDTDAALRERGVSSAGGWSAREFLEHALAKGRGVVVATGHTKTAPRAVIAADEVAALVARAYREEPVLGRIFWSPVGDDDDDDDGFWEFEVGPVDGHEVAGVLAPGRKWNPLAPKELPRIRKTVQWVRKNDKKIRAYIAGRMWEWWAEEFCDGDPGSVTEAKFRDRLQLAVLRFDPGADPYVVYEDQGLLDGYGVQQSITPNGRFVGEPQMG
jgi:hypothetical protein